MILWFFFFFLLQKQNNKMLWVSVRVLLINAFNERQFKCLLREKIEWKSTILIGHSFSMVTYGFFLSFLLLVLCTVHTFFALSLQTSTICMLCSLQSFFRFIALPMALFWKTKNSKQKKRKETFKHMLHARTRDLPFCLNAKRNQHKKRIR